jgi:hypothetical protein
MVTSPVSSRNAWPDRRKAMPKTPEAGLVII